MLGRLIGWSIRNRVLVAAAAGLVLVAGTLIALRMPVDVFPDLSAPTVTVLTDAHGMGPEEIEALVTFPIETALNGATGIRRVRSSTAQGFSIVWADFDWGTDVFRARQIVAEKLQPVGQALPPGVTPPLLAPVSSIMGEIQLIAVRGEGSASPMDARTFADWVVRPRLLAVPGVSQVIPLGGDVRQYQVLVDPARLAAYRVSLDEVLDAARGSSANASGGIFMDAGQEYLVRGTGRVRREDDIARTAVAVRGGTPVLIGDVAEVVIGPAPPIGRGSVNAGPAVILSIQRQPEANTLELTERIDATLDEIEADLPAGLGIDRGVFRQATFIETAIGNVLEALRDSVVLVVLAVFLFLWSRRATLISVLAIPLSLAGAVFALGVAGITINTMTLGGMAIAIGALVDDAVIDVENVFRRLRENRRLPPGEQRSTDEVVLSASVEIRASIVTATLIVSVVFVPLFFLGGLEGRMLRPLGLAYITAVMTSLVVALTVIPALASALLPRSAAFARDRESWVVRGLRSAYGRVLGPVLAHRTAVLAGTAVLVGSALALVPFMGREFLPEFREGTIVVTGVTVPGTSIEESDALGRRIEEILLAHPGVDATVRRTGRAELDEHAQGANAAEIDARLDLSDAGHDAVVAELREAVTAVPGTEVTIGQPIRHRIDHMLSGTRASIAINIYGPDLQVLREIGREVEALAAAVPGAVDVAMEPQADVPQVRVAMDRSALAMHGMTPAHLADAIGVAFAGEPVARVLEGQRSFDLVVRFAEPYRGSLERIGAAPVSTPAGTQVPLESLAAIRRDAGPNQISRENVQRKIVVQSNVAGRDVGSVVGEIGRTVEEELTIPEGYYIEYAGQFESAEAASRVIGWLSLLAVALIFLLLFLEFGSAAQASLVMANLPLALAGGVYAVVLTGGVLNIATMVGFITLFGIAVRNGVLLVSRYNHLVDAGLPLRDAVWKGSMERVNPITMTALTTGLALLPLALAGGEAGNEIQSPLAVVVLGGLLTALALNMVVVPVLYIVIGRRRRLRA